MTARIGEKLRDARVRQGIELSDAEQETKIRAKYLRALEEERWELLPGDPYTRGFLVSYAEFLELDPGPLVAAYRGEQPSAAEPTPVPETMLPQRGFGDGARVWAGARLVIVLIVVAALALVAVVVLTGGSEQGGRDHDRDTGKHAGAPAPTTTPTDEGAADHPARVELELRSAGTVWVCLVDAKGRQLIDGETLTPDEQRGPFKAHGFEATFGNGAVALTVDGEAVSIPDLGEPLGYSIGPDGVDRLGESARPTCV
jgi:hypothetical protein